MNAPVEPAVRVRDLEVSLVHRRQTPKPLVRGVSFDVPRGSVLGLVGESGSGKSLTALSLMRLHREPVRVTGGSIVVDGLDVLALDGKALRDYRGRTAAMVYQNPMSALNPVVRVGAQVAEAVRLHVDMSAAQARRRVEDLFGDVGIDHPADRFDAYPFEMSGGMLQRVVIAMAMAHSPALLIADEATTALDVTTQATVLALLRRLGEEHGTTMVFITHDLAVASEFCDTIHVMCDGRVVERGTVGQVFGDPRHPYTQGLVGSLCTLDMPLDRPIPTMSAQARTADLPLVDHDDLGRTEVAV